MAELRETMRDLPRVRHGCIELILRLLGHRGQYLIAVELMLVLARQAELGGEMNVKQQMDGRSGVWGRAMDINFNELRTWDELKRT
jgi:hypothetical protein